MKQRKFKLVHLILIVAAVNAIVIGYYRWTFSKPFDQSQWLEGINDTNTPTVRKRMLRDIRRTVLRPDISREEIIQQLGDSDTDEYFRGYGLVYWVGPDSSYIDSEWLVITLDEDGKFVQSAIMSD